MDATRGKGQWAGGREQGTTLLLSVSLPLAVRPQGIYLWPRMPFNRHPAYNPSKCPKTNKLAATGVGEWGRGVGGRVCVRVRSSSAEDARIVNKCVDASLLPKCVRHD